MAVATEKALSHETMVLPSSEAVASAVLADAAIFQRDPQARAELDAMGVVRTELEVGKPLDGCPVLFKDERVQPSRSYKSRGASVGVARSDAGATVYTYSTGNHGRSVALAANCRGQKTVVEATRSISSTKREALQDTGAEVHAQHGTFRAAQLAAEAQNGVLVPPFGSHDVLAGQCTAGQELVEDLVARGLAHEQVVIPVSAAGGGWLFGIAAPIWQAKQQGVLGPNVFVVGVQPEHNDTLGRAVAKVRAGEAPVNLYAEHERQDTLCDALVITEDCLHPDTLAVAADTAFVQGFATIDRVAVARAVLELEEQLGGPVEPAAALPYAYAKQFADMVQQNGAEPVTFVLPVSGGNRSEQIQLECERIVARADFAALSAAQLANGSPLPARRGRSIGTKVLKGTVLRGPAAAVEGNRHLSVSDPAEIRRVYLGQLAAAGIELLR